MLYKIWNLFLSFLKKDLIIDFKMGQIDRERLFTIPLITNYIRINNFELVASEIIEKNVLGNTAELGVYKGEFAKYINKAFPDRKLYLFDTFEGFNSKDIAIETNQSYSLGNQNFSNTSINEVLNKMTTKSNCIVKKGWFPESLNNLEDTFCFVSIDADLYKPIYDGLEYFYPRLNKGGYIFVHDYNNDLYKGSKAAVRDYCQKENITYTPIADSWGTVVIAK
ncbi:MAG: class I SAM-dependent methyltransferase [Chitinophagaceae bacterium]|nr:class I SAM-dependent methyltransferase [Chitinophagaceae bacterium]